MQPVRRYALDAAILFSDILVIVEAFGMRFVEYAFSAADVPAPPSGVEVTKHSGLRTAASTLGFWNQCHSDILDSP
jgi:uroporphyrinogen-III decarboxylase